MITARKALHTISAAAVAVLFPETGAEPLNIDELQRQITNGAPAAVADTLAVEAEKAPSNAYLNYNHGVAAYAARRWEDALVSFDRVEMLGNRKLSGLAKFQRGNAEYQLGAEARAANLDETVARWKAALEAYQGVLKDSPDDGRTKQNDAFVRKQLAKLLLEDAKKSFDQAQKPGQSNAARMEPLRNAFEKYTEAKEISPANEEATQGEAKTRDQLAEVLKQEGIKNTQAPLVLKPNRREPRLPDVDSERLEEGIAQLEENQQLKPGDPEVEQALAKAKERLAEAKVKQAETYLALEEQIPITKEKLALLRMAREQVDKALVQSPEHKEAKEVGEEIDRRMAQVHEDEGDFQEHQSQFGSLEQKAMQLSQALDHFQQAGELKPEEKRLDAKQERAAEKLADALDKLADKLMQTPKGQESMEGKAARLEGAEQALNELQSLQPSERTAQRAEQVGKELDGLRQMMAEKGQQPGQQLGQGEPNRMAQGQQQQPQWMGPPMDGPPRIDRPGSKGAAPKNAGYKLRDY